MLQRIAVCCSLLQCVAVSHDVAMCMRYLSCINYGGGRQGIISVLECVEVCCSVLQCAAVCCSVLQCLMTWVCAGAMVGGGKASAALAVAHTKAAVEVVTRCVCLAMCFNVLC